MIDKYYSIEKSLCFQEEFYGFLLMNMKKSFDNVNANRTACVYFDDIDSCLDINSRFFNALIECDEKAQISVLKHELMHLCFFHLTAYKKYFEEDQELANIAGDLSVNCYLPDIPKKLVVDGEEMEFIDFEKYKVHYNLEPFKDLAYYYEKLKEDKEWAKSNGSAGQIQYETDETTERMKEQQLKGVVQNVINELRQKGCTKIPSEVQKIVEMEYEDGKYNYRHYLSLFFGKSVNSFRVKTRKRPSKRFPDSCGSKTKHYCKVLNLIDTSGSVDDAEIKEFCGELVSLSKRYHAEVDYVCFDTKVYDVNRLKNPEEIKLVGRGGTSFADAVNFIKDNYKAYDCFMIMTDGYDVIPDDCPRNVLWILSSHTDKKELENVNFIKLEK